LQFRRRHPDPEAVSNLPARSRLINGEAIVVDRERRARYIGEWLKTEAQYLAS
jgi:hypothetical protein